MSTIHSISDTNFRENMPDHGRVSTRKRESYLSSVIGWLRLKKYQYEVTFSLYMLTPTEKLVFSKFTRAFFSNFNHFASCDDILMHI